MDQETFLSATKVAQENSTMAQENSSKKLSLKTSDGDIFEVKESIVMEFLTVKPFIDDEDRGGNNASTIIPLPNVSTAELSKIIDYCSQRIEFRINNKLSSEEAETYDADFIKALSNEELKEMILAANYLNVKDLLELLNQAVANLIQNKSVEFVREFFGIENDYTEEEEAQLRKENAWAFEGVDED